jgi:hypothetical protein
MGVPDLLLMVLVRLLGIACLHGTSLTTVSTRYASTTSMYMSPILLSLKKLLPGLFEIGAVPGNRLITNSTSLSEGIMGNSSGKHLGTL